MCRQIYKLVNSYNYRWGEDVLWHNILEDHLNIYIEYEIYYIINVVLYYASFITYYFVLLFHLSYISLCNIF